jgi:hypothetical protein
LARSILEIVPRSNFQDCLAEAFVGEGTTYPEVQAQAADPLFISPLG